MKNILCYGDSNTWGWDAKSYNPEIDLKVRYPRDNRWTGRLQKLLSDDFYVIEEGLNGRTTNLDSPDPPDRKYQCYYFNMSPHIRYSDIDGVHFNEKAHRIFADLIAIEIKKIFQIGQGE